MTHAGSAAELSGARSGTGWSISNHAAGGAAVALGSSGIFITSVLYALSPPSAALPAQPFDQALAHAGAIAGARTMHAAGTVGIFSDIVMMVGVLLVTAELVRRNRGVAAAGWAAIVFSVIVFTFVDALVGYVLAPVAVMKEGAAAFAGFKHLFDVLFLLGTLAFGAGAIFALLNDLGSNVALVNRSLALAGILAGIAAVASAAGCFAGMPLEQGVGLSIGRGSAVFTGIGVQIARSR